MNILPAVGVGLLFLYVAKGNKMKRDKYAIPLPEARYSVFNYGELPDFITIDKGERFALRLPESPPSIWAVAATPPGNEISHVETFYDAPETEIGQGEVDFVFQGMKKGRGSIVLHRTMPDKVEPVNTVEVIVEVS